jgi:indolepyruvate ferredoxin oxidoreductase
VGRDHLPDVQEELRHVPGVTVIVYDQRCAAEARRMRKQGLLEDPPRRVVINEAVCEGCGDCSTKSNCLSVLPYETEFGEKRRIHESSCNRDYTCLDGDCPSFVTIAPARGRPRSTHGDARRPVRPSLPPGALPIPPAAAVDGQYGIYFTGVGGTGVVTANRIVAAAGEAAGYVVGGMDQTGLSQMAGAVVSHLHLATERSALGSAAVAALGADLYLSGDLLQAASPVHLEKVDPGRTIAVVDRDVTPTAAMLQTDVAPPDPSVLEAAVADRVGDDRVVVVHAKRIAESVFGNHLLANVVLLGAAFQAGGLPLSLDDLERGIGGTGRAAGDNREAFEWGRWAVHDPVAVERAVAAAPRSASGAVFDPSSAARNVAERLVAERDIPEALRELVTRRAGQVIDYQNAARAARYLGLVERAIARDDVAHGWALTRAVAESWFKLLTYKDEYEVARLHLLADYGRVARDLGIEGGYSVTYHLHPPVLRRMGLTKKMPLGKPYEYAFRALRGMKRLRGTPFDVFGWDPDRRTERALIEEYEQLVDSSLARKTEVPYDLLVEIAASPTSIKGYGPIKERAVAEWRAAVAELRRQATRERADAHA